MNYKFWISSSQNISFNYQETFTIDDLGYEEEEWDELSEKDKEDELDEYVKDRAKEYIEYGYDTEKL